MFKDNLSFDERVVDKKLGYIKYHLIADAKKDKSEVKIHWDKKMIEVNGKKVAWHTGGEWKYTKLTKTIQDAVNKSVERWVAKRTKQDPPTDSDGSL